MSDDLVVTRCNPHALGYVKSLHNRGVKMYRANPDLKALIDVVKHPVLSEFLKNKLNNRIDLMEAVMLLKTAYYVSEQFENKFGREIDGYELSALVSDLLKSRDYRQNAALEISETCNRFLQ